jgi:tRNA A37 N6-isopentenylltransferase MiaA
MTRRPAAFRKMLIGVMTVLYLALPIRQPAMAECWPPAMPCAAISPAATDQGALRLLLAPPRAEVYARCDARLGGMIDAGALDEVRALDRLGLPAQRPAMRALGVPHLLRHVRGEAGLEEVLDAARTATRRYAKRQMTWFRHRMVDWHRLEQDDRAELAAAIDGLLPAG